MEVTQIALEIVKLLIMEKYFIAENKWSHLWKLVRCLGGRKRG